jgi:integrase
LAMPKKAHFRNVNRVKWRDEVYYYHRPSGIRLVGDYGSPEFARSWAEAETKPRGARHISTGDPRSYSGLVDAFQNSAEWEALKPQTRADYSKLARWMHNQGAGNKPASGLTQDRCEKLLDKAVRELGWRRGLYVLQFNRRLYNWVLERAARKKQWGDTNPWIDLKNPQRPKDAPKANRPWKGEELFEVLFDAPPGLRRAYVLGASGMDGSTIIARRWDEYRNGGFYFTRPKTETESWAMVPPVFRFLLEADVERTGHVVLNQNGEPFVEANTLQTRSSEYLRKLAKAGKVGPGLTLHGLRHTAGKAIADSGGTLRAVQQALAHKTTRMALFYSEQADKKRALLDAASAFDEYLGLQSSGFRVSKGQGSDDENHNADNG